MKKSNWVIIIIAVILIGVLVFLALSKPFQPRNQPINKIVNVDPKKLPSQFPGIPVDLGASVVNNYNAISPDGRMQSTRTIQSPASVFSNFVYYRNYLIVPGSGWTFLSEVNNPKAPNHKALFAKNGDGILNINISAAPEGSIVDISFLVFKSAQ